ncbi:MAG: DUF3054 domain-containing protein [Ilumatobacteraceae bacterium]
MSTVRGTPPRLVAVALDAAAVLLFVVAGRGSHDEGGGIGVVFEIAAPFLIGVAAAWLLSPNVRARPWSIRAGVDVWFTAVIVGMLLRRFVWDRGTALSFVVVTTIVLGILVVGWRAIWSITGRRRRLRSVLPPAKAGR